MIPNGAKLITHVTILDTASEKLEIIVFVDQGHFLKQNQDDCPS